MLNRRPMTMADARKKLPARLEMGGSRLLKIRLMPVTYAAIMIGIGGLLSAPLAAMRIVTEFYGGVSI
jgi:hypothetical protein